MLELRSVVMGMVRLSETFGYALPWANLLEATTHIDDDHQVRLAVDDLIDRNLLEATIQGLRFALSTVPDIPTKD